jgi:hypothetical protein
LQLAQTNLFSYRQLFHKPLHKVTFLQPKLFGLLYANCP